MDETRPHAERAGRWSWLRLAVVDTRPLRRREFRLLFLSRSVSFAGTMVTFVAIPYQVFQLTRSPVAVGLLGLVELLGLLLTASSVARLPTPATGAPWCGPPS